MASRSRKAFSETCVIYESAEDACWVAHGVRTDQMGLGDSIVDALVEYMKAIEQVLKVASEGKDITILRPAPSEVRAMAKRAKELPEEIFEIAHKKLYGKWPRHISINVDSSAKVFRTKVTEPALA